MSEQEFRKKYLELIKAYNLDTTIYLTDADINLCPLNASLLMSYRGMDDLYSPRLKDEDIESDSIFPNIVVADDFFPFPLYAAILLPNDIYRAFSRGLEALCELYRKSNRIGE